ncbi:MAG: thioredoxin family protein [Vicinamibacterales bacterium]
MRTPVRSFVTVLAAVLWAFTAAGVTLARQQAPLIYPPSDARADIAVALAAAKADGRHVLIDFGADWCPDCRVLARLFEDPSVAPFVAANFHVVHVDVGRRDRNADVVAEWRATSDDWIPAIVVVDPAGRTIARTDDGVRLTRRTTPAELVAHLRAWAPKTRRATLAGFVEHGVRVTVAIDADRSGGLWLAATYAPVTADTHLYATSLPDGGIDGLGRPTRLVLAGLHGLRAIGPVVADRPTMIDRVEALDVALPIYPAGPVTLRVPVVIDRSVSRPTADVSVSYMACSPRGCLRPVIDRRMNGVTITP